MERVFRIMKFDFLTCRKTIFTLLLFFFAFGLYYGITVRNLLVIPVSIMFWFSMLAGIPFTLRDRYSLDNLLSTFPINRRNIVRSRYLLTILIGVLGISISEIQVCIASIVFSIGFNITQVYFAICFSFLIYFLIIAIHLPLYFKMAHSLAVQISPVFLYFIYIVCCQLYYSGILHINLTPAYDAAWNCPVLLLAGTLLLTAAMLLSSYIVSIKIYLSRDL